MVGHHIAQRAGRLVIAAALLHAQCLRHRDLYVVDVAAVPDGLEDAVGKAEHQNVLHRFLAQVMVDAVDLPLLKHLRISRFSARAESRSWPKGFSITTRRHVPILLFGEPGRSQLPDHLTEKSGRGGQIVEVIPARAMLLVDLGEYRLELLVGGGILKVALPIIEAVDQPIAELAVVGSAAEFRQVVPDALAELVLGHVIDGASDQREILRQQVLLGQVIERRQQHALGQIAGCAEDHHGAAVRGPGVPFPRSLFGQFGRRLNQGLRHWAPPAGFSSWPPN